MAASKVPSVVNVPTSASDTCAPARDEPAGAAGRGGVEFGELPAVLDGAVGANARYAEGGRGGGGRAAPLRTGRGVVGRGGRGTGGGGEGAASCGRRRGRARER